MEIGTIYDIPEDKKAPGKIAYVMPDGLKGCERFYIMTGCEEITERNTSRKGKPYGTRGEAQKALDRMADARGWRYSTKWNTEDNGRV